MVTINKNIFSNQDNGLSLSSSKKNTDELFAELFSIVNSDQNLSNLPPDKSKNNNKELYNPGNLTLVDTKVSDIEIEAAKYLAETFYKEIGIIDDKESYQIDKISEFATKKIYIIIKVTII